jgi:hypothetical protein
MKKYLIVMLMCCQISAQAQNTFNTTALLEKISSVKVMADYIQFKSKIENEVLNLTQNKQLSLEQMDSLKNAYNLTKVKFDIFLVSIEQDIIDIKKIRQSDASLENLSQKYQNSYNEAIAEYENSFAPVYAKISQTRSLWIVLFKVGRVAFNLVVQYLFDKKIDSGFVVQEVLSQTVEHFKKKLFLKKWDDLVANNNPKPPVDKITIPIDLPVISDLKGNITLISTNVQNQSQTTLIQFEQKQATRSLNVTNSGKQADFVTKDRFDQNNAFQIKIKTRSLVYVFAYNNSRDCFLIYPFSADMIQRYNLSKNRSLGVGPLMLKNENDEITIPSKNVNTGEENYITIEGQSEKEELCIIISKSEIEMNQLFEKIQSSTGNLLNRLQNVLGENIVLSQNSKLSLLDGVITFEADNSNATILPILLEIRR